MRPNYPDLLTQCGGRRKWELCISTSKPALLMKFGLPYVPTTSHGSMCNQTLQIWLLRLTREPLTSLHYQSHSRMVVDVNGVGHGDTRSDLAVVVAHRRRCSFQSCIGITQCCVQVGSPLLRQRVIQGAASAPVREAMGVM